MSKSTTKRSKNSRRLDKNRITLHKGETQRSDGTYSYRWTSRDGQRHDIYAKTLEGLCEKEEQTTVDQHDGIKTETRLITVNEMFDVWCDLKRGLNGNTFQNYKYMYNMFIRPNFGKMRLTDVLALLFIQHLTIQFNTIYFWRAYLQLLNSIRKITYRGRRTVNNNIFKAIYIIYIANNRFMCKYSCKFIKPISHFINSITTWRFRLR